MSKHLIVFLLFTILGFK